MTTSITDKAREVFQSAYENRYTWDENFPGYTADLELQQVQETYQAKITVFHDYQIEVKGIEDITIKDAINRNLWDIVTHRKRSSFAVSHSKNTFTLGEQDANGAVEVLVSGDAMGSQYKVTGKVITQVSRQMGGLAFTIDTQSTFQTEQGYLPTQYQAIFRDAQSQNLKATRYHLDTYEKIGSYYLPSRQVITTIDEQGQTTEVVYQFTNIQLFLK
jgi:Protein of unknown function (DUF3386)